MPLCARSPGRERADGLRVDHMASIEIRDSSAPINRPLRTSRLSMRVGALQRAATPWIAPEAGPKRRLFLDERPHPVPLRS